MIAFSLYCFNDRTAMYKYLFHPYSIYHNREHYRFLTHAFIHGDFLHLGFNCLALFTFGLDLERYFLPAVFGLQLGKVYYILLFTGGIYAASFTEYFMNRNNPNYSSLGASGAISAVTFCYIMVSPLSDIYLFSIHMPGWIMGVLLLGVSYLLIRRKRKGAYSDNISHESHFWGALFGVAFILALKPSILKSFIHQISEGF